MGPVAGSRAQGDKITGIVHLRVDGLPVFGSDSFRKEPGEGGRRITALEVSAKAKQCCVASECDGKVMCFS